MVSAERDMLHALVNEYEILYAKFQSEFWEYMIRFLETSVDSGDVADLISQLKDHIYSARATIKRTRYRKLKNLTDNTEFLPLERVLDESFEFLMDLDSLINFPGSTEEYNAENDGGEDLRNIQRILMTDEEASANNQPPNTNLVTRTFGESTNQETIQQEVVNNSDFYCKVDSNGRIEGQFVNDKVVNLSKRALSEPEISVLSKGLKFIITRKEIDFSQIKIDLENFGRRLRLKWHFRESENFSDYPAFKPRSKFNPRDKDAAIKLYLSKLEEELMNICVQGNNYSNVTREELAAINNLKADRTIVIKETDKGSGVVVRDREDYIQEAEGQLGDSEVYSKLDSDPSGQLHQIITYALDMIRDRGDIDEKTFGISHG